MAVLLGAVLKAILLYGGVLMVERMLLHRASAAIRHLLLATTLMASLLLPVLPGLIPAWRIPLISNSLPAVGGLLFRVDGGATTPIAPSVGGHGTRPAARQTAVHLATKWPAAALAIWLAGFALLLIRIIGGSLAVRRMARRAVPATGSIRFMAASISDGLTAANVRLGEWETMPLVCGVLRPIILLPAEATQWPEERLRTVLLHEMAHVRRRDILWQMAGELACAVYWPNPLVWLVRRRAMESREAAADDMVLQAGVRATDYAERLLEIARSLTAPRDYRVLAMVRPGELEVRLQGILSGGRNRTPASRRVAAIAAAVVLTAVVALAAMRTTPQGEDDVRITAKAEAAANEFDFTGAVQQYRQALRTTEARFGRDSVEAARVQVKLGTALRNAHEHLGTEDPIETALAIFERVGPLDRAYAEALYRSGIRLQIHKEFGRARERYQRGIEVARVSADFKLLRKLNHVMGMLELADPSSSGASAKVYLEEAARLAEPDPVPLGQPEAVPLSPGTYRISQGIETPKIKQKVEPAYSDEAIAAKFQGVVVLQVEISAEGKVDRIRVVRPLGMGLDEEAVRSIRQWQFQPARKDNRPVRCAAALEVNFRLL